MLPQGRMTFFDFRHHRPYTLRNHLADFLDIFVAAAGRCPNPILGNRPIVTFAANGVGEFGVRR